MAQVEYTEQFNVAYTSGVTFYVQLRPVLGNYVVKALTCYATAELTSADSTLSIVSSTDGSGTNSKYIFSVGGTVAANTIIPVFSPTKQVVLTQQYLGFKPVGTAGTMQITVTYSFIPSTSDLLGNFGIQYSTINNTTGASFTGSSSTIPRLLKSITVVNPTSAGSVDITPKLTTASTTAIAFDVTTTVAAGATYVYTLPLAITSTETIAITSAGAADVDVYYSYTQENS